MLCLSMMPLGSCRVHNALIAARDQFGAAVETSLQYGLIYNAREVIQQIAHMRGEIAFPRPLHKFLNVNAEERPAAPGAGFGAGVYFVELSTRKTLECGGVYLQETSFSTALRAAGGFELFKIIWHGDWNDPAAVRSALAREPAYARLPDTWRRLLAEISLTIQDDASLATDMKQIVALLRREKMVFVSHCNAIGRDGRAPAGRQGLIDAVAAHSAALGVRFFDPTPMMAAFGQSRGFCDEGADLEHYTPAFEAVLAQRFLDLFG